MFSFFSNFNNMLYPANTFLSSVLPILKYNPSTYDIDELTEQMNQKEECEINDCTIDVADINKKLPFEKFFIQNINIKKTIFVFKRSYMTEKTKLCFENIIIDVFQKKNLEKNEVGSSESTPAEGGSGGGMGGFLNNVINIVVHNLEVEVKNIEIKFYDKENKNVEYTLFIKKIGYKEGKNLKPLDANEKIKYLFFHNKALYIGSILFKEKYEEKDENFFENVDKDFINNEKNILYINNEIELDIFHNNEKNMLTLSNINDTKLYFETIFNKKQLISFYKYFYFSEKKEEIQANEIKGNNEIIIKREEIINNEDNEAKQSEEKKPEEGIDIMGFKIKKFNFEIKIFLLYMILKENKDQKKFISLEEGLISEKEENIDEKKIINYFNQDKNKYYLFNIYNSLLNLNSKKIHINNLSLTLIEPENDNNINNDKNIINENNNINDLIKYNSKKFLEVKNLNIDINKIDNKFEFIYDNIYIEINHYLFDLLNLINKNNKKDDNQNKNIIEAKNATKEIKENNNNIINTNVNIVNEEEVKDYSFNVNGKKFNVKIFLDMEKTLEDNKLWINNLFNKENNKNIENKEYFDLVMNNLLLNEKNDILFDKIEITYNSLNKSIYPIIKIAKSQNSEIIYNKNELNVNLCFKLLIFINPNIVKKILKYLQKISPSKKSNNTAKNNNTFKALMTQENNKFIFNFNFEEIKIYLIENQNPEENNEINLPQNEIIIPENNDYICLNIKEISFKIKFINEHIKSNFCIKSVIIQDQISNSKYKVLLSNYYFKKDDEIFIKCDLDMLLNSQNNKYEVKSEISLAPLAIYLDQISLYYIFNILEKIKENENINNNDNNGNNEINNDNNEESKYIINDININNTYIILNYTTNENAKDTKFLKNGIITLFNTTSINKLKILFQKYTNKESLTPKNALKKIYEYYSSDIINQVSGSALSALPLFYHIYDSVDGMFDIVREPIQKYNKKESVMEGLVKGVQSWVIKTATMFTYLGESIGDTFTFRGCRGEQDDVPPGTQGGVCRNLRHLINHENKDMEEYYLK